MKANILLQATYIPLERKNDSTTLIHNNKEDISERKLKLVFHLIP